jgi:Gram-negative bacterial TonB protein C-terminal
MKAVVLFLALFNLAGFLHAQEVRKDSGNCSCSRETQLRYPDMADSEKIEGTVIVEYEIDTFCMAGNPKIVQSLGVAYDKEAIRVIKLIIAFNNSCKSRCRMSVCTRRKVKLSLTFRLPDEE